MASVDVWESLAELIGLDRRTLVREVKKLAGQALRQQRKRVQRQNRELHNVDEDVDELDELDL